MRKQTARPELEDVGSAGFQVLKPSRAEEQRSTKARPEHNPFIKFHWHLSRSEAKAHLMD
jgi:hypothetical protein